MEQFYTILTDIGKAKVANATALQKKLELSKIVLGDSNGNYYEPVESQTELKNKVWEGEVSDKFIDKDNPNWIIVQTIIPSTIGGFVIREAGIVDAEGDLVVVAKYPETYKPKISDGSTKDITINLILEVSNVENVTLKVDPTIIFATKKDIQNVQKALDDIKVPVESVNGKKGEIELSAADIKTKDGTNLEKFTEDATSQLRDFAKQIEENVTYSTYKKEKDENGKFKCIELKRKNNTLYKKSILSGASPNYGTRIEYEYDNLGSKVITTKKYGITYDDDGNVTSEVLQ